MMRFDLYRIFYCFRLYRLYLYWLVTNAYIVSKCKQKVGETLIIYIKVIFSRSKNEKFNVKNGLKNIIKKNMKKYYRRRRLLSNFLKDVGESALRLLIIWSTFEVDI